MTLGKIGARPMVKSWTAGDYVRNGLVAMWDGIENAGWGVHDAAATTWVDLSGNGHNIVVPQGVFGDNSYDLSRRSTFSFSGKLTSATVEFVGRIDVMANDSRGIYLCLPNTNIAFGRYNTKGLFSQTATLSNYGNTQFILPTPYPRSMSVTFYANGKNAVFDGVEPTSTIEGWTSISDVAFIGNSYDTGVIHAIRIYSRALTAAEIAYTYNIDKMRFNLP